MRGRRFKHSLSHYRLLTGDMGNLMPCGLIEVLPGDSIQHSCSALVRLSPMVAPVMHSMQVRIHHFFVPHRLIWEWAGGTGTFEDFMTGGEDGNDAQTVPTVTTTGIAKDLLDYYGIPTVANIPVSALPIAGYNAIFNEYYRDQDLEAKRNALDVASLRKVAWEKDYLTSARPWTQKGDDVTLPLGDRAPVLGIGKGDKTWVTTPASFYESDGQQRQYDKHAQISNAGPSNDFRVEGDASDFPNIYADLAQATAANVNAIRLAFALQRFQEARARYGSRYTEYLRYLGITPSDARLDRPEYLGGGRVGVAVSEVLQTSQSTSQDTGSTPEYGVGDMYGHGIAAVSVRPYRRFFEEHGYVHSFISIRPKAIYTEGIDRTWLRRYRDDFFQRELQYIGQQEVWQNEVQADVNNTYDEVFGYQDRYREYREQNSQVAGEFRDILDYWHMGRTYATAPALNGAFVRCTPTKRIFQEQTQDALWMMVQHSAVARRLVNRSAAPRIL